MKPLALPLDEMVRLYESGLSMREVGAEVGCSNATVSNTFRRAGIQARPPGHPKGQKRPPQIDHEEIARETGVPVETVALVAGAVVVQMAGRR